MTKTSFWKKLEQKGTRGVRPLIRHCWIVLLFLIPCYSPAQEISDAEWAQMAYEKGQRHELDRNWEDALRMYEAATQRSPNVVDYHYRAAYVASQLSYFGKAQAFLQPILLQEHAPSWNLNARLLLNQGKIAQAKEWFERAIRLEPGSSDPYFGLAQCAEARSADGDASAKSDAIAHYQVYLERATDGSQRDKAQARLRELKYGERGVALNQAIRVLYTGQLERAERMLTKLVSDIDEGSYWLGVVHQKRGNDSAALRCWTQALPLPAAQLAIARQMMGQGRYTEALFHLQDAQRRAPHVIEVSLALGRVYLELNRPQEAEEWLRRVVRDAPQHPEATRAQELLRHLDASVPMQELDWSSTSLTEAQLLQRYGGERHDLALQARLEAIVKRLQAGTPELSYFRFHIRILQSDIPNAWPSPPNKILITQGLIHFVDTHPDLRDLADDALAFILGHEIIHLIEYDTERAGELQSLLGLEPMDFRVRQTVIHRTEYNADRRGTLTAYQAQFDPFAAIAWCRASRDQYGDIPEGSDHPTFDQRLNQIHTFLLQDLTEAHSSFKEGVALLQQGDMIRAAQAFEMYLSRLPTDTEALYNLALAYFYQGIAYLPAPPWAPWEIATEVAVEPMLPSLRPKIMTDEADRLLNRARVEVESILRRSETHTASWRLLGDIVLAYRDLEAAREHYSKALNLRPDSAVALNNMGVLACLEEQWEDARRLFSACSPPDDRTKAVVARNLDRLPSER